MVGAVSCPPRSLHRPPGHSWIKGSGEGLLRYLFERRRAMSSRFARPPLRKYKLRSPTSLRGLGRGLAPSGPLGLSGRLLLAKFAPLLYQQLSGARAAPISSLIINCQPHYQHLLAAVSEPVNRLARPPGGATHLLSLLRLSVGCWYCPFILLSLL